MAHWRSSLGFNGNDYSRQFAPYSSATARVNPWSRAEEEIRRQTMHRYGLLMAEKREEGKKAAAELKSAAQWEPAIAYEIGLTRTVAILDRLNHIASKGPIDLPELRRTLEEEAEMKHAEVAAKRANRDFTILNQMARELESNNSNQHQQSSGPPTSFYDRHRNCLESQPPLEFFQQSPPTNFM